MAYFLVHSLAHSMYLLISFLYSLKMTHEIEDHDEEKVKSNFKITHEDGDEENVKTDLAISGTSGSSGLGSQRSEQIESRT